MALDEEHLYVFDRETGESLHPIEEIDTRSGGILRMHEIPVGFSNRGVYAKHCGLAEIERRGAISHILAPAAGFSRTAVYAVDGRQYVVSRPEAAAWDRRPALSTSRSACRSRRTDGRLRRRA